MMKKKTLMALLSPCVLALTAVAADDLVIADFERDGFGDWKEEGEVFGEGPTGDLEVLGREGDRYVSSHHGEDESTGTLTSPEFRIERNNINFRVFGGYEGETCINLIVKNEVVRTAIGPRRRPEGPAQLDYESWDVREFKGENACIQIVDRHRGEEGHIIVDHIAQSDRKLAMMRDVTRNFTFEKKYLNIPVDFENPEHIMRVLIDNEIVREFSVGLASGEPQYWVYLELDELKGKAATVHVDKLSPANKKSFDLIHQADTFPGESEVYKEKGRPRFHFSAKRGWICDPNGLMYYDGEYHLFYQHNTFACGWGNLAWGHAVSDDLVHWEEFGDAIIPDELGSKFSGSGVVDWNNTTGFQTGEDPPMICIYTSAGGTSPSSDGKPFTQCIAYSNDRGRTWTKYAGNPVQDEINGGNRDPKVIWWEETNEWVIILYLEDARMAFFRSPDLKRWELQSVLKSFHECPELFQLAVDGDEDNKKWVHHGGSGDYLIGDFDGSTFTPEGEAVRYNYGNAFYASQTFNHIPKKDGRRIQMGWATIFYVPEQAFNQALNFPVELTLRTTDAGIRLFANPVEEIKEIHGREYRWKDGDLEPGDNPLGDVKGDRFDIHAKIELRDAEEVRFNINGFLITYNVKENHLSAGEGDNTDHEEIPEGRTAPLAPINGKISLRILVDRPLIEIFANDGRVYMPMQALPFVDDKSLRVYAKGGGAHIEELTVYEIQSIWP